MIILLTLWLLVFAFLALRIAFASIGPAIERLGEWMQEHVYR